MPSVKHVPLSAALISGSLWLASPAEAIDYHFDASDADPIIKASVDDRFGSTLLIVDLDGDGQDDLVAAGPRPGEDRVYVFFGPLPPGSAPDPGAADVIIEGMPGGEAGWSLAAGDFDGDGAADLAVGAPSDLMSAGQVYVFAGPLPSQTLTVLDATSTVLGEPGVGAIYAGWSVAAGDFDGDGVDELAVGACGHDQFSGRSYLFDLVPGVLTSADATALFKGGGLSGCSMANAGDFDGDGVEDLVIGAPGVYAPPFGSYAGALYLVYGRAAFAPVYDMYLGDAISNDIARVHGRAEGQNFAWAIDSVGDVNLDGYPDLLVGAPSFLCDGCLTPGHISRTYLILGGKSTGPGLGRVLHGVNRADDVFDEAYVSNDPGVRLGFSVAGTGWVGSDLSRLNAAFIPVPVHGTTYAFGTAINRAVLALYSPERFALLPRYDCTYDPDIEQYGCVIEEPDTRRRRVRDLGQLIDPNGNPTTTSLRVFDGDPNDNLAFGARVASGGDLSGDGINDLVIADPDHIEFTDETGADARVYLYEGR